MIRAFFKSYKTIRETYCVRLGNWYNKDEVGFALSLAGDVNINGSIHENQALKRHLLEGSGYCLLSVLELKVTLSNLDLSLKVMNCRQHGFQQRSQTSHTQSHLTNGIVMR